MRSNSPLIYAMFVGLSAALVAVPVSAGEDLILPPDLRAPASSIDTQPEKTPPSKRDAKTEKKPPQQSDAKRKVPASSEQSEPASDAKIEKPVSKSKQKDEDALSVGMKWNAANDPNAGPGSLFDEVHKNVNGATTGSGAEVGFKYKF
jgi:hypothetical protein